VRLTACIEDVLDAALEPAPSPRAEAFAAL
jgi:hypothetical protein